MTASSIVTFESKHYAKRRIKKHGVMLYSVEHY